VEVVDKWDFYLQHNFKYCEAAIILTNHKLFIFVFLPFFSLSVTFRNRMKKSCQSCPLLLTSERDFFVDDIKVMYSNVCLFVCLCLCVGKHMHMCACVCVCVCVSSAPLLNGMVSIAEVGEP